MRVSVAARSLWVGCVLLGVLTSAACSSDADSPKVATLSEGASQGAGGDDAPPGGDDAIEAYLAKQQEFVDCVRKNGHPDMHDPDQFGAVLMSDLLAVEGATLQRIMQTCKPLIEGNNPPPELLERQQDLEASKMTSEQKRLEARFATCMQHNGVPEYPDPQPNGLPRTPAWELPDATTPTPAGLPRALDACLKLRGGGPEDG